MPGRTADRTFAGMNEYRGATTTMPTKQAGYPRLVEANGLEIYVDQVGQGPDVLLIGGLGDTVESWQFQLDGLADRYRLTAFDNRGAGRTAMPGAWSLRRRWPTTRPRSC